MGLFIPLQPVEFLVYFVQSKEHVFLKSDTTNEVILNVQESSLNKIWTDHFIKWISPNL